MNVRPVPNVSNTYNIPIEIKPMDKATALKIGILATELFRAQRAKNQLELAYKRPKQPYDELQDMLMLVSDPPQVSIKRNRRTGIYTGHFRLPRTPSNMRIIMSEMDCTFNREGEDLFINKLARTVYWYADESPQKHSDRGLTASATLNAIAASLERVTKPLSPKRFSWKTS